MKISKIFKGIIGIGAVSGIAYAAYKCGEFDGKAAERKRQDSDNGDDEIDLYDEVPEYDEPDVGCIAPAKKADTADTSFSAAEDNADNKRRFAPIGNIKVEGVSESVIRQILLRICMTKTASNKMIRDSVGLSYEKAADVLNAFADAGYVGRDTGNHKIPVYVTMHDFFEIIN